MKHCLKKSQQLLGDVTDACYQLLEQCLAHIGGSDLTLTQKRMQDLLKRRACGDEVEIGSEVRLPPSLLQVNFARRWVFI